MKTLAAIPKGLTYLLILTFFGLSIFLSLKSDKTFYRPDITLQYIPIEVVYKSSKETLTNQDIFEEKERQKKFLLAMIVMILVVAGYSAVAINQGHRYSTYRVPTLIISFLMLILYIFIHFLKPDETVIFVDKDSKEYLELGKKYFENIDIKNKQNVFIEIK